MFRIIIYVIKCIPNLIYIAFFNLFHINVKKYSKVYLYNKLNKQICSILRKCNIELVYTGLDNLPNEQSYLICPNHQSMLDAFIMFSFFYNEPLSFVGKESIKKIPLLSGIFRQTNSYFMNRSDLKSELKIMKGIEKSLLEDDSKWVIFPEGTRTKDTINYTLNPFKAGALKFPMRAEKKIIPVALFGTHHVLDKKNKNKVNKVCIHFFPAITPDDYKNKNTQEVAEYMHEIIQEKVNEFKVNY